MTLPNELDLDILPLDLRAKIQVCMSVRSRVRARHTGGRTDGRTDGQTDRVKTITPVADAGCNNQRDITKKE